MRRCTLRTVFAEDDTPGSSLDAASSNTLLVQNCPNRTPDSRQASMVVLSWLLRSG